LSKSFETFLKVREREGGEKNTEKVVNRKRKSWRRKGKKKGERRVKRRDKDRSADRKCRRAEKEI